MNAAGMADSELCARCVAGDNDAAAALVRRFSNLIYQSTQFVLISKEAPYNDEDLEDLHNTIWMHLFEKNCKKLRQFKGKNGCTLATWLRIVSVRIVLNYVRKKGFDGIYGRNWSSPLEIVEDYTDQRPEPCAVIDELTKLRLVREAVASLPARYRHFFKLHCQDGHSLKETAEAMGISVNNVHGIRHRLIQKIRACVALMSKE